MVTNSYRHHPAQDNPDALLWGLPFHGHFPISRFQRDLSAWTSPGLLARLWKPQSLSHHPGTSSPGHGAALDEKMQHQSAQLSHTVGLSDIFPPCLLLQSCYLRFETHRQERWVFGVTQDGHVLENSSTRQRRGNKPPAAFITEALPGIYKFQTRKGFRTVCHYPVWQNLKAPVTAEGIWEYQGSGW